MDTLGFMCTYMYVLVWDPPDMCLPSRVAIIVYVPVLVWDPPDMLYLHVYLYVCWYGILRTCACLHVYVYVCISMGSSGHTLPSRAPIIMCWYGILRTCTCLHVYL